MKPDRFMREIKSVEMITGKVGRETLWPCLHVVIRRQDGSKRRRCIECAAAHYAAQWPYRESLWEKISRIIGHALLRLGAQ